jgi:hypothetical protein
MNAPALIRDFSPAIAGEIMETVLIKGDLRYLKEAERVTYHNAICQTAGLNPLTRPFAYIELNGKLTLYALKACTDQLRQIHGVSISILSHDLDGDLYTVHVKAKDASGREDEDFGVVVLPPENRAQDRANAILKAVTKAKRRATLSICGLGFLDETEVEDIPASTKRQVPSNPDQECCAPVNQLETQENAPDTKTETAVSCAPIKKRRRGVAADRKIDYRYEEMIRQDRKHLAFDPAVAADADPEAERRAKKLELELAADFNCLRDELERCGSVQVLHQWGDDNQDRIALQPEGRKAALRMAYTNKLASLKPHSIAQRAIHARAPLPAGRFGLFTAPEPPPHTDYPRFGPFDELPEHSAPPKDDGLDIPRNLRRYREAAE